MCDDMSESDLAPSLKLNTAPSLAVQLTHLLPILDILRRVKLVDMGEAAVVRPGGAVHTFAGTPSYLAPEVARIWLNMPSDGAGRASDWWTVGAAIYEMAFGFSPFTAYDDNGAYSMQKTLENTVKESFEDLR